MGIIKHIRKLSHALRSDPSKTDNNDDNDDSGPITYANVPTALTDDAPSSPPCLPAPPSEFLLQLPNHPKTPTRELLTPYLAYETWLRKAFANPQTYDKTGEGVLNSHANLVPIYAGHEKHATIRKIDSVKGLVDGETGMDKYIMRLPEEKREEVRKLAITESLGTFEERWEGFTHGELIKLFHQLLEVFVKETRWGH